MDIFLSLQVCQQPAKRPIVRLDSESVEAQKNSSGQQCKYSISKAKYSDSDLIIFRLQIVSAIEDRSAR